MNFRNSSPKARSAIPDSKWELGVCARVPPHKCAFCTPSRSSLEVFKVRIGSMGKNILGGKKRRKPYTKARYSQIPQDWNASKHLPPSNLHTFHSAWLLILLLISLPLEGSPLFYIFILKSLPRENSIKLGFRPA